jgi:hypothetical protein
MFLQSLEILQHKRNPQRDVSKTSSSRPTGNSKNMQPQRPRSVPPLSTHPGIPAYPSLPISSTHTSTKTSTPLAVTSPSSLTVLNETMSTPPSDQMNSLTTNTLHDEGSSPPPSYEVTEWTAFLDRIQRNPSSATYEVRQSVRLPSFHRNCYKN